MGKYASQPIGLEAKAHANFENAYTIFDQTANNWQPMAFAANQEQNEKYTFNNMLKQYDIKYFFLAMKKEFNEHTEHGHWTIVRRSDVSPGFCDNNGKLRMIISIWSFKKKRFPDVCLMKYKSRLCSHVVMHQWGVNRWKTYAPVLN